MNKTRAVVLASFTIWPALYLFIITPIIALTGFYTGHTEAPDLFKIVFALHLVTFLVMVGLLIYYLVHLYQSDAIAQSRKALWGVLLFMGHAISMPVYWYRYIWKPLKSNWTASDDVVAFYISRYGSPIPNLPVSMVAISLGVEPGILNMHVQNFLWLDGKGERSNVSEQARCVFESYRKAPKSEHQSRANHIIVDRVNQREKQHDA